MGLVDPETDGRAYECFLAAAAIGDAAMIIETTISTLFIGASLARPAIRTAGTV